MLQCDHSITILQHVEVCFPQILSARRHSLCVFTRKQAGAFPTHHVLQLWPTA